MKCRICGDQAHFTHYTAREMMFGSRDRFDYFQCGSCYCLQIKEVPHHLSKYYPSDYNGFASPSSSYFTGLKGAFRKQRYLSTLFHRGFFNALFPAKQYQLLATLNPTWESRILDVGCGQGSYLYPLYELGLKHVQGVDPFISGTIQYANGYQVEKAFVTELKGEWDIILYNHSFEHVPDPLENLLAVKRLLAADGSCIIRIPTVSSYAWEHYKTNWFQLDAPRHLFLHSRESMRLLANQAGLDLIDVIYDSSEMQFIGSEMYSRDIPMSAPQYKNRAFSQLLQRKLKKWKYQKLAIQLNKENRGDQAAFVLKPASGN